MPTALGRPSCVDPRGASGVKPASVLFPARGLPSPRRGGRLVDNFPGPILHERQQRGLGPAHERPVQAPGGVGRRQEIGRKILAHKEAVESELLHADEAIALLGRQETKGRQARPGVDPEAVDLLGAKLRIVGHRYRAVHAPQALNLCHHHSWPDHVERLPDPVVDAVEVERERSTSPVKPSARRRSFTFSRVIQVCTSRGGKENVSGCVA